VIEFEKKQLSEKTTAITYMWLKIMASLKVVLIVLVSLGHSKLFGPL